MGAHFPTVELDDTIWFSSLSRMPGFLWFLCSGCFITCMGVHFPAVELDDTIWFSSLSTMPGFLWHSSKWTRQFGCLLQYMLGLEVSACSLETNLNYATAMLHLCLSLNRKLKLWQLLGGTCSNFRCAFSWIDTIVCIGVSTQPPPPPVFLAKPPLNQQTVQASNF